MRRYRGSTVARLRLAATAVVAAGLVFGAAGLAGLSARDVAVHAVRADTHDMVRLQRVRTALVTADAAAGTDVLLGADQPRLTPHDYAFALQPAVLGLVLGAGQPGHDALLAVTGLRVTQYTADIEVARTAARQGRPDAVTRLQHASGTLRAEILPRLVSAQQDSSRQVTADQDDADQDGWAVVVVALTALLILASAHLWLTLRTRRLVNTGLAAGLLLVLTATVISGWVVAGSQQRIREVVRGPHRVVQHLVDARIAAFQARAAESLAVATGQVTGAEREWKESLAGADAALGAAAAGASPETALEIREAGRLLDVQYASVHAQLLTAAAAGRRSEAVTIATSPTVDGSTGAFEDFDATSAALLARQVQAADDGWAAAGSWLAAAGWLCLVSGLGAAITGWRGIAPRLREYA